MEIQKNRTLETGQLVEVYYHIKKHIFSIRDKKTKLVLAHAKTVSLQNPTFKVSQAGRKRVLKEGQKNVHAHVEGTFLGTGQDASEFATLKVAYYNPKKTESFIDTETLQEVENASFALCQNAVVYYQ